MDFAYDGDGAEIEPSLEELIELAVDEDIDNRIGDRYSTAIWAWQSAHGCTVMDLQPAQMERFVAWKIDCDVSLAVDLIRQRRLLAQGVRS